MITRCPACGTMFKVVPDQLRISEGWVRCGHCTEVFDASASLQPDGAMAGPAAPSADPARAVSQETPTPAMPVQEPTDREPEPALLGRSDERAGSSRESTFSAATPDTDDVGYRIPDAAEVEAQVRLLREDKANDPELDAALDDATDASPVPPEPTILWTAPLEPVLEDLSFVRKASRQAFWRSPLLRAVQGVAVFLAALMLLTQWSVLERDRLAASAPALAPALRALCQPLDCEIRALRQIESIGIDNSAFNRLRADTYRLSLTLRNQAPLALAMPALELTLTDGQDQAVLRRVLQPSEIAPANATLAPSGEWSTTLALAVSPAAGRIAGYRVLAFYP